MNDLEFTPGPWRSEESPSDAFAQGLEILADGRDEIAVIPLDDTDAAALGETEGNARLIVAAPALALAWSHVPDDMRGQIVGALAKAGYGWVGPALDAGPFVPDKVAAAYLID